jgi:methyl-accepting chemotaxis protein
MIKSLRTKLGISFGIIFIVLLITTAINLFYIEQVTTVQDRVINLRFKTVNAGKDINNGINLSLAALRGYMILGANPQKAAVLKAQRKDAWVLIEKNIEVFDDVSNNWTVSKNVQTLDRLKKVLLKFKNAQQEVENIAQHKSNISSYEVLLNEAAPRAGKILKALTEIIDIEEQQPSNAQRKAMLVQLANSRGSFAIGLANIRAFLLSGDVKFKQKFTAKWEGNNKAFQLLNSKYLGLLTDQQQVLWSEYSSIRNQFSKLPQTMFEMRQAPNWNQANYILANKAAPNAVLAINYLHEMQNSQNELLETDTLNLKNDFSILNTVLLSGAILSFIISVIVAIAFSRNLLNRLSPVLQKTLEVAENNLSTPQLVVTGKDEIAVLTDAVNKMNAALISTLTITAESMRDVSDEANSIYHANTDMSKSIDQQNNQMNMIAAAVEELSSSSKDVSNSSEHAAQSAAHSLNTAIKGGDIVKGSLSQMDEISEAFDESAKSVASLSEQSKEVEAILSVIRGIAEQTNLLALNAAIEAARAGEQGRGFAVVADEVRQLASRTTSATADVEQAIDHMRTDAQVAEKNMEIGRNRVHEGKEISGKVEKMLNQIIDSASDVSDKVKAIAITSSEQSLVTVEIAGNTNQVSSLSISVHEGINNVVSMTKSVSDNSSMKAQELMKMIK